MSVKDITFKDFYNEDNLKDMALLFGNGLPRSYPKTNKHWKEVKKGFELSNKEYIRVWREVNKRVKTYIKLQTNGEICPEKLLNYIRILYGILIFRRYQEKQEPLTQYGYLRFTSFLNKFSAVYTLNYDNFSFVSIFEKHQSDGKPKKSEFDDGFDKGAIPLDKIIKYLKKPRDNRKPFFFLHGAFNIFQDKSERYKKICSDAIVPTYSEIDQNLEGYLAGNVDIEDPVIIFSGRPCYKNAALLDDPYLEYCVKRLSLEKKVFSFGCSFVLDSHILDAIFKPLKNGIEEKEIFLGYYSTEDKKNIEGYISKNKKENINVTFVNLSSEKEVSCIVWECVNK